MTDRRRSCRSSQLADVAAGVLPYRDVPGFTVDYQQRDIAVLDCDGVRLVRIAKAGRHQGTESCDGSVDDADALYAEALKKGAGAWWASRSAGQRGSAGRSWPGARGVPRACPAATTVCPIGPGGDARHPRLYRPRLRGARCDLGRRPRLPHSTSPQGTGRSPCVEVMAAPPSAEMFNIDPPAA